MTEFKINQPCDWHGEGGRCGQTPTAWPGDIYYACEDHFEDWRGFLTNE